MRGVSGLNAGYFNENTKYLDGIYKGGIGGPQRKERAKPDIVSSLLFDK